MLSLMGVLAGICLVPATPSLAAFSRQLTLTQQGARVIIDTAPFRLTFAQAQSGRPVLQEVPGGPAPAPGAQLFPVLFSPKAPGDGGPVYQPLAFQVGGQTSQQLIPFETAGDQTAAAQGGVVFSPQSVTNVKSLADGYRLTVSTSDPTRTMTVLVTRDRGSAIRIRASLSDSSSVSGFGESFTSAPGEAFHGFGGRHNSLDQAGNSFYSWPEQESIDCGAIDGSVQAYCAQIPGGGGNAYQLPNGATETYYPQNQFVSSRSYAFLLNEPQLTRWRMAADNPSAWQVNVAGPALDYSVVVADGPAAVRGLSAIAGSQIQPAAWAQESTLSRAWNVVGDNKASYHDEILSDLKHIEGDHIPVKAYAYEAWRGQDPGFVREVNARLRRDGIHPVGYLRPMAYNDGAFDNQQVYDQADKGGYGARDATGQTDYFTCNYGPRCILTDFTNPAARKWWAGRVVEMLDLGFDGFMQDFGEQVTTDMHFANGETGDTMHNEYPVLYHQLTHQVIDQYMRSHPGRDIFFYTRSGYSGRPGTVGYDNGSFPGDETTSWTAGTGLPSIVPDMLNRAVGGGLGYDTDLGGYTGLPGGYGNLNTELWLRWNQAGVFTPYFRVHNADIHMPWDPRLAAGTEAKWGRLAELHNRAVPLIRKLWAAYPQTGIPPAAPLWLMFPGDARAATVKDEWMVGRDLLVAPVLEQGATARSVYFPAGCWRAADTGETHTGPTRESTTAPLDRLPYFNRCGTDPIAAASVRPGRLGLPGSRRCASQRRFLIHLRAPYRDRLRLATVFVNGRRTRVLRGRRLRAPVDLRGLPRGRFVVRVAAVTRRGRRLTERRSYRTCTRRRRGRRAPRR